METPKLAPDGLVDNSVVLDGRFPAHAANQTDGLHKSPLTQNCSNQKDGRYPYHDAFIIAMTEWWKGREEDSE